MYRVLQIGMTRNIGGMETYLMQQYRHLDRSKIQYDFVNITAEYKMAFSDEIKENGDTVYELISRGRNPIKHYLQWIYILIKNHNKYDAVTLNTCTLGYMFPLLIAKIFGINKRIVHSHNSGNEIKIGQLRRLLIEINRIIMNFSVTDYWACSKVAGKWMFKGKKFKIINNAIESCNFIFNCDTRQNLRHKYFVEDKVVIGHVGRFSYQKNHEFLIDIFYELSKKNPSVVLWLIGGTIGDNTYLEKAKRKVALYKLEDKVKFFGLQKNINELMQAMDCFLLPSKFEGLPVVGIEAQAAGLPCFFSDTITYEAKITDLVEFISLKESPNYWASKIDKKKNSGRENKKQEIVSAGYDIDIEVSRITDLYVK